MTLAPFAPITLDLANQAILETNITRPALGGLVGFVRLTLRELYDKSDLVVIGRAAGSVTSRGNHQELSTRYQVASVLKGKSTRQQISVTHYGPPDEDIGENKTALLFLSKGTSENGGSRGSYVLADVTTGIKALPQAEIDIFASRLRDLEAIERRDYTSADIIEWLVQCAEDPVTREEGAYELTNDSADPEQANDDKPACKTANPGPGNQPDQVKPEGIAITSGTTTSAAALDQSNVDEQEDTTSDNLASRLTETQKERLVTSLLATQAITEGDLKLIEIIKVWKDPRLVDFLLARLHGMEDNPPEIANELVGDLADIVAADEVAALADQFTDLSAEEANPDSEGDRSDQGNGGSAEQSAKMRDAAQKRSAALKEFLAVVERRRRGQPSTQP